MLETVASTIAGTDADTVGWQHSRDDVVEGVETLFSAIKERDDNEAEILKSLWEIIEKVAVLAGEAFEMPIELGVLAGFAPFAAIGAGYMEAADEIKRKKASISFAEGLVLGVMAETSDNVRDYFWQENPSPNPAFPESEKLAQYYANGGLALGYTQGKEVFSKGLATAFWTDVKAQLSQPLGDPDLDNWGRREWIDYYITAATAFYRGHISE